MVIDNVIWFIWVIVFLSIGVAVAFSGRHKGEYAGADNVKNEELLSFPQRHWFLIVIVVAILSPVVFSWVQAAARHRAHQQSTEQPTVHGGSGGSTPMGGAVPPGDTAQPGSVVPGANPATSNGTKDTSYHVATPPQH